MTYIKLEDAVKAVAAVQTHFDDGTVRHPLPVLADAIEALRSLPTDDGEVLAKFAAEQEPLGADFEKILNDNIEQLYSDDRPVQVTDRQAELLHDALVDSLTDFRPPMPVSVTDEMVERVARAICAVDAKGINCYPRCNKAGTCLGDLEGKTMEQARAALEAALGPLPAPPAC